MLVGVEMEVMALMKPICWVIRTSGVHDNFKHGTQTVTVFNW